MERTYVGRSQRRRHGPTSPGNLAASHVGQIQEQYDAAPAMAADNDGNIAGTALRSGRPTQLFRCSGRRRTLVRCIPCAEADCCSNVSPVSDFRRWNGIEDTIRLKPPACFDRRQNAVSSQCARRSNLRINITEIAPATYGRARLEPLKQQPHSKERHRLHEQRMRTRLREFLIR